MAESSPAAPCSPERRPWRERLVERAPRPPRPEDYPSRLHSEQVAARVGLLLGVAFTVCFFTGLISHFIQHPPSWWWFPTRPVWIYRLTQGVHITSGIASIPLLLIKLWTVSPRFWQWPPITSVVNALERLSIFVLVGAAFFQLISGLLNVAEYYPWKFFFPPIHYAVGWIAIGALAVHIAVKLPVIRRALTSDVETDLDRTAEEAKDSTADPMPEDDAHPRLQGPLTRRGLLALVVGSAGLTTVATVGDKIPLFRSVSVLAQRNGSGPQGLPVNRTAHAAGVTGLATDDTWQLQVVGDGVTRTFTLQELQAMPQTVADLPIACVEGWSQTARWTGVRIRDLAATVDGTGRQILVHSVENGLYGSSVVPEKLAGDDLTLIALQLGGEPLDIDHGYPARLIAPNRPGALQTKWVRRIEVI